MKDERKTKKQLIEEINELRKRLAGLESDASRESEVFRLIRSSTPIGLFILQDGKFVFVNETFRRDTGLSPQALIGSLSARFIHPEDRDMVRENAIKMLKGQSSSPYKYRYRQPGRPGCGACWKASSRSSTRAGGRCSATLWTSPSWSGPRSDSRRPTRKSATSARSSRPSSNGAFFSPAPSSTS